MLILVGTRAGGKDSILAGRVLMQAGARILVRRLLTMRARIMARDSDTSFWQRGQVFITAGPFITGADPTFSGTKLSQAQRRRPGLSPHAPNTMVPQGLLLSTKLSQAQRA